MPVCTDCLRDPCVCEITPAAPPAAPTPRAVNVGEVLGVLYNELTQLIREHQQLKGFEQRVVQAAKSPAAWLALREGLGK